VYGDSDSVQQKTDSMLELPGEMSEPGTVVDWRGLDMRVERDEEIRREMAPMKGTLAAGAYTRSHFSST